MATPLDLTTLEPAVLDRMRIAIATEQERRKRLEQLPAQLADMARAARAAGVPEEDVRACIEGALSARPATAPAAAPTTTTEQETTA